MAVFRIERTRDYTVMSNHHLKDTALSLKAKGLLSMMLSLPDEWNYTTRGLAAICKEGVDAIGGALRELEKAGYIVRRQLRGPGGRISDTEYTIYEKPCPGAEEPPEEPGPDTTPPDTAFPYHRSIQDIFNLCFRAGFVIDGFYEECFKTNKEIPMVMIVRLKKVKRDSLK